MKKGFIIVLLVVTGLFHAWGQQIWNVNNLNSGIKSDFTTLQAAIDSAAVGDIIYLQPSPTQYSGATIRKKLTIIGAGYNIPDNVDYTEIRTYTASAKTSSITIDDGGEGSVIVGLEVNGCINLDSVDNILIQRNKIIDCVSINESFNVLINGNYFSTSYSGGNIDINNNCSGVNVNNNIVAVTSNHNVSISSSSSGDFKHNIFLGHTSSIQNSTLSYNIFLGSSIPSFTTNAANDNIFTSSSNSIPSTNRTGIKSDSIFVGYPTQGVYSLDSRFHLLPEISPALSSNLGTGDNLHAGAFGGSSPYKLSGIPFIPTITEIIAPATGTSAAGLPISIKVRANN